MTKTFQKKKPFESSKLFTLQVSVLLDHIYVVSDFKKMSYKRSLISTVHRTTDLQIVYKGTTFKTATHYTFVYQSCTVKLLKSIGFFNMNVPVEKCRILPEFGPAAERSISLYIRGQVSVARQICVNAKIDMSHTSNGILIIH